MKSCMLLFTTTGWHDSWLFVGKIARPIAPALRPGAKLTTKRLGRSG
jgi:hypothetical protein